jgi:death-on-curing protein|tara:strand:- start:138 stop:527 length:390 start_codon:yes stop_codon:yes gene_type:complete
MTPTFLSIEEVLAFHLREINKLGGEPSVRDMNLLSSAVNMPQQMFGGEFVHESIYEMAAAYLFHIVNNHPFVDGNKRTGLVAALVFLEINGIICIAEPAELYQLVIDTATNILSKEEIATFFRNNHEVT